MEMKNQINNLFKNLNLILPWTIGRSFKRCIIKAVLCKFFLFINTSWCFLKCFTDSYSLVTVTLIIVCFWILICMSLGLYSSNCLLLETLIRANYTWTIWNELKILLHITFFWTFIVSILNFVLCLVKIHLC